MSRASAFPPSLRAAAHEVRCSECRVSWPSWAARLLGRPRPTYVGPISVGRLGSYLGRQIRVDYDPPRGRGWHGRGRLESSQPWESPAHQVLFLDPAVSDDTTQPTAVRLILPLGTTVEVLP